MTEGTIRRREDSKLGKPSSPYKKLPLERNPNFFKGQKGKVEVEIFTKSPPKNTKEEEQGPVEPPYDPTIQVYVPYPKAGHTSNATEEKRSSTRHLEPPSRE